MNAMIAGFGLTLGMIMAIGAQNAFILRQGILRQHVLPVVLICALSDAFLTTLGVAGFGTLVLSIGWLEAVMRWGGAAFLLVYGARAFLSAYRGGASLEAESGKSQSLRATVITCLVLTYANPHVYLDTIVLLGSLSAQYDNRLFFALGSISASIVFFFSLGYGARLLAPLFATPRAWQVLDVFVGSIMWIIAFSLMI